MYLNIFIQQRGNVSRDTGNEMIRMIIIIIFPEYHIANNFLFEALIRFRTT